MKEKEKVKEKLQLLDTYIITAILKY